MAKADMICPFSRKMCKECEIYRGKHYFLCYCRSYRGYLGGPKAGTQSISQINQINFKALEEKLNPWTGTAGDTKQPEITLKILDLETNKVRVGSLGEAKNWNWKDARIMRIIDGRHITSWNGLCEMLRYKAEKGFREVELHEGPRFMLLSGG